MDSAGAVDGSLAGIVVRAPMGAPTPWHELKTTGNEYEAECIFAPLFLRLPQEPVADLNPPVVKAGVEVGDSKKIVSSVVGWCDPFYLGIL